jgi:hypothetical protein
MRLFCVMSLALFNHPATTDSAHVLSVYSVVQDYHMKGGGWVGGGGKSLEDSSTEKCLQKYVQQSQCSILLTFQSHQKMITVDNYSP